MRMRLKSKILPLALTALLGPIAVAPGLAEDEGYLVPPTAASEVPIVVGAPHADPTPRVEVRDTVVERPLAYKAVAFGSPPEAVAAQLPRFQLKPLDSSSQGLAYAGSGEFLGTPATLAALFTPTSRKLFSLGFTTALQPGEPWSLNVERYRTRLRLLAEKYGPPTREMEAPTAGESVWCFLDGELQCTLASRSVRVVYVHEPGLLLMRDEQDALRREHEARLKDEL